MADKGKIGGRIAAAGLLERARAGFRSVRDDGPGELQIWLLALLIGAGSGAAALFFRKGIEALQSALYGSDDMLNFTQGIVDLPRALIVLWPVLGGLVVGCLLYYGATGPTRVRSVADVIEGAALRDGRVETRAGFASAAASLVTLGSGGSTGREGPVVHIAAMLATWVNDLIHVRGITARDLLGCAVAAAVSASFNAPLAGALFALEVVLRHFAIRAFAPIAIASAVGTVINRLEYGDITEFRQATESTLTFYEELPAFLLLGVLCGLVATVLMRAVFWTDETASRWQDRFGIHPILRPAGAGLLLGVLALAFPQIIGVGYETTSLALTGQLGLGMALLLAVVKAVAVAITMGGRMGGGIFSPSLMMGALTGLAFGILATRVAPGISSGPTIYALAGMGAVAGAVLGAPISTTLIVFELTGDWQTGLAVMVAVSSSTAVSSRLVSRSFFLTQLERRQVRLAAGPQTYLLRMFRVANVMRPMAEARSAPEDAVWAAIEDGAFVEGNATLAAAMPLFEETGRDWLPVVRMGSSGEAPEVLGVLLRVDALVRYNRALAATAAEEHN